MLDLLMLFFYKLPSLFILYNQIYSISNDFYMPIEKSHFFIFYYIASDNHIHTKVLQKSQLLLGLAVLGQVEGGDLFGLLNLLLVGLDLLLKLVNQVLHALVALLVLVGLEGELLDLPLALAESLVGISVAAGLVVELRLELLDASPH